MLRQWVSTVCVLESALHIGDLMPGLFFEATSDIAWWTFLYFYVLATKFWLQLKEDKKEKLPFLISPLCCQHFNKADPKLLGLSSALQGQVQNFIPTLGAGGGGGRGAGPAE